MKVKGPGKILLWCLRIFWVAITCLAVYLSEMSLMQDETFKAILYLAFGILAIFTFPRPAWFTNFQLLKKRHNAYAEVALKSSDKRSIRKTGIKSRVILFSALIIVICGQALFTIGQFSTGSGLEISAMELRFFLAGLIIYLIGAYGLILHFDSSESKDSGKQFSWAKEALCLFCIILIAAFLRYFNLRFIPSGIYLDECDYAIEGIKILTIPDYQNFIKHPYWPGGGAIPSMHFYFTALSYKIFGINAWSMRLVPATLGVLTIPVIYCFARYIFNVPIALVAAFLLAVSRWHINFSRINFSSLLWPFLIMSTFYFFFMALEKQRKWLAALAGLSMGLAMNTYHSAYLLPFLVFLYVVYKTIKNPFFIKNNVLVLIIVFLCFMAAYAPLLVYTIRNPETVFERFKTASVWNDIDRAGGSWRPLIDNIYRVLTMNNFKGDPRPRHNIPRWPMLDPFTAIFFTVGFFYALRNIKQEKYLFLLVVYIANLQPGIFSLWDAAPHSIRVNGTLPVVLIFAAVSMYKTWESLLEAFPKIKRSIFITFFILVLLAIGFYNFYIYFIVQARNHDVFYDFDPMQNRMGEYIKSKENDYHFYLETNFCNYSQVWFNNYKERNYDPLYLNYILPYVKGNSKNIGVIMDPSRLSLKDIFYFYYPHMSIYEERDPWGQPLFISFEIPKEDVNNIFKQKRYGHGLTALYFNNTSWEGKPVVSRVDPTVLYSWYILEGNFEGPRPDPALPLTGAFSVIWKGILSAPESGFYTFGLKSEQGSALYIDNKLVVNNLVNNGLENLENRIDLVRGAHSILIKYFTKGFDKSIEAYWLPPMGAKEILPPSLLTP